MSRLSELTARATNEFRQQAEHTQQALESVMQQHRQAIENDLNGLRSAIAASIRESGEEAARQLNRHIAVRPKRIARLWWTISTAGIVAALLTWGISAWQMSRAAAYYREAESLRASGATITDCTTKAGKTVRCVLVNSGTSWQGSGKGTQYMEIRR